MSFTAIFFDAGGTLVFPDPERTLAPLRARGVSPSDEQLYAAERDGKQQLDRGRAEHHSVDAQYWDIYYQHLLRSLGLDQDAGLRAALVAATRKGINWRSVRPGTRQLLEALHRRYRLGVISNSDGSIRRLLEIVDLLDCFDSVMDSQHCGCEKPDRRIFQAALDSLAAQPQQSLYVGDIYSIDYVGAEAAGMRVLLMDPAGAYCDTPYPRIAALTDLEDHLQHLEPR